MASIDISNIYTNISTQETKVILNNSLEINITNDEMKQELLNWYDTITKQNYFSYNDELFMQNKGLAIGAPSSILLSEIFLQFIE